MCEVSPTNVNSCRAAVSISPASAYVWRVYECDSAGRVSCTLCCQVVTDMSCTLLVCPLLCLSSLTTSCSFLSSVTVIETLMVFVCGYLAYICAEIFHFSGIMRYASTALTVLSSNIQVEALLHCYAMPLSLMCL